MSKPADLSHAMLQNAVPFLSLLFTTLSLAPALAHLLELPNKIDLPRDEYLTVQQIYRGWALLGTVVVGALVFNLAFAILARNERKVFIPALIAFLCVVAAQQFPATGKRREVRPFGC